MFRYQPNLVEFSDRLLFVIGAPAVATNTAVIQRLGNTPSGSCDYIFNNPTRTSLIDFGPKAMNKNFSKKHSFPSTIPREAIYEMAIDDTVKPFVEARLKSLAKPKKLDKREYGFF